jgi:hypothetical protein
MMSIALVIAYGTLLNNALALPLCAFAVVIGIVLNSYWMTILMIPCALFVAAFFGARLGLGGPRQTELVPLQMLLALPVGLLVHSVAARLVSR